MKKLIAAALCLLLATAAAVFAIGHAARLVQLEPHGLATLGFALLAFLGFYIAGVGLFRSWRGAGRTPNLSATRSLEQDRGGSGASLNADANPGASAETRQPGLKAGVYGLVPGLTYRVIRPVRDHYGTVFAVGEELIFVQRHYLPYHGGHTVVFRPRPMYLQDKDNEDVLGALDAYLEIAR